MRRMILVFVFALTGAGMLSGCNTVNGAGKDLESAGRTIQDTF